MFNIDGYQYDCEDDRPSGSLPSLPMLADGVALDGTREDEDESE